MRRTLLMWGLRIASKSRLVAARVRRAMLSNIVVDSIEQHLAIEDEIGRKTEGMRKRSFYCRWFSPDYLPEQRISLGPTGRLSALRIEEPSRADSSFIEGGIGCSSSVIAIRAPRMRPTYLVREPKVIWVTYR